jgi:hypothetical protein
MSCNPQQARSALEAVLASDTLARSDQLRSFLRYVGEKTLSGGGHEINEYSVAVEALGKGAGFSPAEDSSVRTRAYELRQKLQKYYEKENPEAPIRVELPKGSYTPRFVPWDAAAAARTNGAASVRLSRDRAVQALAAALVVALVAVGVLGVLTVRSSVAPKLDPVVREFWGPLTRPDAQVLISVGTVLHLVVRPYMTDVAEGLPKYTAPPELYPLFRQHRPLPEGEELSMHPVDNSVQVGHMSAVVDMASTLRLAGAFYQILPERSTPAATFRGRNVIVIGDPQNSDAAARVLEKLPLTIDFDSTVRDLVVRERGDGGRVWIPKRGRDKRYTEAYGLITMLQGEDNPNARMVVLSGITSVGTHGAAEFFCKPESLALLRRQMGSARLPVSYQVVVRCASNDTLLLSSEYAAHRVISN